METSNRSWELPENLAPLLATAIEANAIARDLWNRVRVDAIGERIARLERDLESFEWNAENSETTTTLGFSSAVELTIALREAPGFLRTFAQMVRPI